MKITDMLVSAIIKRGILYEARNCDMEFEVPLAQTNAEGKTEEKKVKIQFKAEHMKLSIEKEKGEER